MLALIISALKDNSFWQQIYKRFFQENFLQTAAALSFTSLLSLIPLMTVCLVIGQQLPFFDVLIPKLERLIKISLLPPGTSEIIMDAVNKFGSNAVGLTWVSMFFLAFSAITMVHTIESTFNRLWKVQPRPKLQRLRLYLTMITLWPLLLGALIATTSMAITTSLGLLKHGSKIYDFLHDINFPGLEKISDFFVFIFPSQKLIFRSISFVILWIIFTYIYLFLPNIKYNKKTIVAALFGGCFAGFAFVMMKYYFEIFIISSALLNSIYGAFAFFPIFLIWLEESWVLLLIGGLIAVNFAEMKIKNKI